MAAVESGRVRQASVVCAVLWVALAGVVLQAKADVPFTADSITYFPVDTFDIFSTEANITITHLDWDSKKVIAFFLQFSVLRRFEPSNRFEDF